MIHIGTQSVAVPGTRVALSATRKQAMWVQVDAIPPGPATANAGLVYLGDKTVTSSNGHVLVPGDGQLYPPSAGTYIYNLAEIYIDASTAADGVRFTYGA